MKTQPEALRLADWLDGNQQWPSYVPQEAASELRRLHLENKILWKEREEPNQTIIMYVRECNRLEKERDELLESLNACLDYGAMTGASWVEYKARAAITKATGTAP